MSLMIRPMNPADLETVVAIERECYPNPWSKDRFRQELENPFAAVDLACAGSVPAGYLCSWLIGDELEIHNVATAASFRRRGVGRALLDHVLKRAVARGAKQAFLEVRADNLAAQCLYRATGFRATGRRAAYYADGEDALLMALILDRKASRGAQGGMAS